MIRKPFAFILLVLLTAVLAIGQTTPEAKKDKESKDKDATRQYAISVGGFGGGSYLGVYMEEVTSLNFSKYGLKEVRGVAVTKVSDDSPAAKAGIKAGDVLVRFNGELITSVRKLRRQISEVAPDHSAKITLVRGGSERDVDVKVGRREGTIFSTGGLEGLGRLYEMPDIRIPDVPRVPSVPPVPEIGPMPNVRIAPGTGNYLFRISSRSIGVSVTSITKQLGEYFGIPDGNGLLIRNVTKDGAADKAGLKAGDVITEVDGKKVNRTYDLIHAMGEDDKGDVTLTVIRDKKKRTVKVTPQKSKGIGDVFFNEFDFDLEDDEN